MFWFNELGKDLREAAAEISVGINNLAGKVATSPPGYALVILFVLAVEHLCLLGSFKYFWQPYNWLVSYGISTSTADFCVSIFFGVIFLGSVRIGLAALGFKLCSLSVAVAGWCRFKSIPKITLAILAGPLDIVLRTTAIALFKYKAIPIFYLSTGKFWGKLNEPMFYYWLIFGCFIAPLIEEIFFRGFLQTALEKRIGGKKAVVVTAFMFAVMHNPGMTLEGFLIRFVKGLIFSALKKWEGTLWAPVAAHSVNNFVAIFFPIMAKMP